MTSLEKKQTGSHYTPQNLANFVANSIFNISDFKTPKILDPACGDGSLLKAIREKGAGSLNWLIFSCWFCSGC